MKKDNAIIILNNIREEIIMANYFRKQKTMCRNLEKVEKGIKDGFKKEN